MNRKVLSNMLPYLSKYSVNPQKSPDFTSKRCFAFHQQAEVQTTRNF